MKLIRSKKILVTVDFSQTSWKSFKIAAYIAKILDLDLYLMHVLPSAYSPLLDLIQKDSKEKKDITAYYDQCEENLKKEALSILKKEKLLSSDIDFKTIISSGTPSRIIIETIDKMQPDLVVIGTRGLSDIVSVLLGGCAERVVQGSSRPVLVVPQNIELKSLAASKTKKKKKKQPTVKLLLPTDFSEPSRHALNYALDLCQLLQGQLYVLHVIEKSGFFDATDPNENQLQEIAKRKQDVVHFLENEMVLERCHVFNISICIGDPVEEILGSIIEEGIQMVIMGTQGRNWFERLLLGSTTESVISRSTCPVLTVHGSTKIDKIEKKYQKIKDSINVFDLQREKAAKKESDEETSFSTGLVQKTNPGQASQLFLGYYSPRGLKNGIEQYGISDLLRKRGYQKLTYIIDTRNQYQQMVRIIDSDSEKNGETLIEFALHEEVHPPKSLFNADIKSSYLHFLVVDWVLLQNPRAQGFTKDRPRLPGQKKPGLGMGFEVFGIFVMAMERLEKDGLLSRPEFYHNAFLYHERCRFASPINEGIFLAITRDTANYSLTEVSWAIERGYLLDKESKSFTWKGEPLILARSSELQDYFKSKSYLKIVRETVSENSYHIDWSSFEKDKNDLMFPSSSE